MMGWEQLPPEITIWRQEFNACNNCEELKKKIARLVEASEKVWNTIPATFDGPDCDIHASALTELKAAIDATTKANCPRNMDKGQNYT